MLYGLTFTTTGAQKPRKAALLHVRVDGVVRRAHCCVLSLLWRYGFDVGSEPRMNFWGHRSMFDLGARWVLAKIVIALPIFRGSDWPGYKTSTAVRTDVAQEGVDTIGTECAFISTDARLN